MITGASASMTLKNVWTKELLDEQMNTLREDMNRQMGQGTLPLTYPRQVRFTGDTVTMTPSAVKMAKIRKAELEQRIAKLKRKGKPSYRQRQRNARAAKG